MYTIHTYIYNNTYDIFILMLSLTGVVELEASIMNGSNLECGSVSLIRTLKNPISAARLVMEKTVHNYLVGEQAEAFVKMNGLQGDEVENSYFYTKRRHDQLLAAQGDGSIALDHHEKEEGAKGTYTYTYLHTYIHTSS